MSLDNEVDTQGTLHSAPSPDQLVVIPADGVPLKVGTLKGGTDFPRSFMPLVVGDNPVISYINLADRTVSYPVIINKIYPFAMKEFKATGTVDVTNILIIG